MNVHGLSLDSGIEFGIKYEGTVRDLLGRYSKDLAKTAIGMFALYGMTALFRPEWKTKFDTFLTSISSKISKPMATLLEKIMGKVKKDLGTPGTIDNDTFHNIFGFATGLFVVSIAVCVVDIAKYGNSASAVTEAANSSSDQSKTNPSFIKKIKDALSKVWKKVSKLIDKIKSLKELKPGDLIRDARFWGAVIIAAGITGFSAAVIWIKKRDGLTAVKAARKILLGIKEFIVNRGKLSILGVALIAVVSAVVYKKFCPVKVDDSEAK